MNTFISFAGAADRVTVSIDCKAANTYIGAPLLDKTVLLTFGSSFDLLFK